MSQSPPDHPGNGYPGLETNKLRDLKADEVDSEILAIRRAMKDMRDSLLKSAGWKNGDFYTVIRIQPKGAFAKDESHSASCGCGCS